MSHSEILETSDDGQWRVRLILDESPDEPYDDGQSPLLRLDVSSYGNSIKATHVMATGRPTDDDVRIEEAAERWGSPSGDEFRMFEKYLRAYYGTTGIETWYSGSYWYVTYDTAAWRAYVGFEPGDTLPEPLVNMTEYRAWCDGDVWGYAVERNVTWQRTDNPGTTMQTWEEEDSCWGYYGSGYAREAAQEAYESAMSRMCEPQSQSE